MRILVTDDCPGIVSLYESLLSTFKDLDVDFAESVDQARSLFRSHRYDLVFMDHDLDVPDVTGLDLCNEIRSRSPSTQLVMVTSKGSDRNFASTCKRVGVRRLVNKADGFMAEIPDLVQKVVGL